MKKLRKPSAEEEITSGQAAQLLLEWLVLLFPERDDFASLPSDRKVARAAACMQVVDFIHHRWNYIWSDVARAGLEGKVWEACGLPAEPPPCPETPGSREDR